MDSMPPATITSLLLAISRSWPSMAAFMPEPHTLLTVVQPTDRGNPAVIAAWRAGAWPRPAGSTQPRMSSCTVSALMPARWIAAFTATAPSCGAVQLESSPWKLPIGVRATEAITTGSLDMAYSLKRGMRFIWRPYGWRRRGG